MPFVSRQEEEDGLSDAGWDEEVEGGSNNRVGSSTLGDPPSLPATQGDVERQRDLQEALLLQMDMQKKLHEQLEVSFLLSFLQKCMLSHQIKGFYRWPLQVFAVQTRIMEFAGTLMCFLACCKSNLESPPRN